MRLWFLQDWWGRYKHFQVFCYHPYIHPCFSHIASMNLLYFLILVLEYHLPCHKNVTSRAGRCNFHETNKQNEHWCFQLTNTDHLIHVCVISSVFQHLFTVKSKNQKCELTCYFSEAEVDPSGEEAKHRKRERTDRIWQLDEFKPFNNLQLSERFSIIW